MGSYSLIILHILAVIYTRHGQEDPDAKQLAGSGER